MASLLADSSRPPDSNDDAAGEPGQKQRPFAAELKAAICAYWSAAGDA
jgi:hypothetical protein